MKRCSFIITLLVAGCASAPRPETSKMALSLSRPAAVRPVEDDYFGHRIVDPYRWMEAPGSPELRTWLLDQDAQTRAQLRSLPDSTAIERRVQALSEAVRMVPDAQIAGGRLFYLNREPGHQKPTLQVREANGLVRTLVDIETSTATSIDYIYPSPKGNLIAYGVSANGTENSTLRVLNVQSGQEATTPIDGCWGSSVAWVPDESAFYYSRVPPHPKNTPARDALLNERIYLRRISERIDDSAIFGPGLAASPFVDVRAHPRILTYPGTHHLVAAFNQGVNDPISLAVLVDGKAQDGTQKWRKIAGPEDGIKQVALGADVLYIITFKDAPLHRLERWTLDAQGVRSKDTLFESPSAILDDVAEARDGTFVAASEGGSARLFVIPHNGSPRTIALPFSGALTGLTTAPDQPEALFSLEGWTSPLEWMLYRDNKIERTGLGADKVVDFDDVVVTEVSAPSHDGVSVPMTLIHRKDMKLDGHNPTRLAVYGSYGVSLSPSYHPSRKVWLEHGGVFAFAHVRGGGEFGEPWHRAGQKANKVNSILDLIACAQDLIRRGVTAPEHLGLYGGSAGGIVVNGAIVRRPDLFGAAVIHAGDVNMLRIEEKAGGPRNAEEFGSVKTKEGFEGLLAMDAYHQVQDGVAYPAVLLSGGMNDPRVPIWQSAKMAARLKAATSSDRPIMVLVGLNEGHGVGSMQREEAARTASYLEFMLWRLGDHSGNKAAGLETSR